MNIPQTISEEEPPSPGSPTSIHSTTERPLAANGHVPVIKKVKRTPYRVPDEASPLLDDSSSTSDIPPPSPFRFENPAENTNEDSNSPVVTVAIYINLAANTILLAGKIAVIVLTSSLSVLASLVDAALDFLSTAIVWTTTKLISRRDEYTYPVGRRRLEPIGVLVFSIIMITSFFQVSLQCLNRLTSSAATHVIVHLTLPAILIMFITVLLKLGCYLWCRRIRNSSVQALSQDAFTDVIFNTFSIIFPLLGSFFQIWWFDALGGLLLSLYVIINWTRTSSTHIRNLTGAAASATDRNILLYLTMRFAGTIQQIQGLQAYHAGDNLIVEVGVVLDEGMSLRDSHDLGESLQYVLESVPNVDRAFVHLDYKGWNLPSHMVQLDE
jgi:cation diffusion facilitator family transporter